MKYIISTIFYLIFVQSALAQPNHNIHYMQWVFGYSDSEELNLGWNSIDFNDGRVAIKEYDPIIKDYFLGRSGSAICDSTGQIELMTNICDLRDENLLVVSGASMLTDNEVTQEVWCDGGFGYPTAHASRFYPREYGYDLLYLDNHEEFLENNTIRQISSKNLYLLKINKLNNGDYEHERKTLLEGLFHNGRLRTTWHRNNKDIWIIMNPLESDTLHSYLLQGDSLVLKNTSVLGPKLTNAEAGFFSNLAFSAQNDMMAMVSRIGIMLYDFDDETGVVSNYRNIAIPFYSFGGVCFSPSDRFLYAGNGDNIFQIDLESDSDNPIIHNYGSFFTTDYGWPIGVGNMVTGPDCRIYISAGSTTNFMHVIHNPEGEGEAANLQSNIPIPKAFDFDFPTTPNLFPYCDPDISFDIRTSVLEPVTATYPMVVFPNPANDRTSINIDPEYAGQLFVYDIHGRLLLHNEIPLNTYKHELILSAWQTGMYLLRYESEKGVYAGKLIKN